MGGPWTGSMKGSMDRVHKGGPQTWGPCFVYVPVRLMSDFIGLLKPQFGNS